MEFEEGTETEPAAKEAPAAPPPKEKTAADVAAAAEFRIKELILGRTKAREEAAAAKARVTELEAAAAEVPTLKQQLAALTDELDLSRAGLNDPDAVEVARLHHARLPEADRPKLGEWWTSLKAEGATVPKALTPWIVAPTAADGKPPVKPPPKDDGSNGRPPPTGEVLSVAALQALKARAFAPMATQADRDTYSRALDQASRK